MIVVACKSESTTRVSSETVADILDPFHVGLVEVTATTENGKNKMRRALVWTIQVSTPMGAQRRAALVLTILYDTIPGDPSATRRPELYDQPCQLRKLGGIHEPDNLMYVIPLAPRTPMSGSPAVQSPNTNAQGSLSVQMKLYYRSHLKIILSFPRRFPFMDIHILLRTLEHISCFISQYIYD